MKSLFLNNRTNLIPVTLFFFVLTVTISHSVYAQKAGSLEISENRGSSIDRENKTFSDGLVSKKIISELNLTKEDLVLYSTADLILLYDITKGKGGFEKFNLNPLISNPGKEVILLSGKIFMRYEKLNHQLAQPGNDVTLSSLNKALESKVYKIKESKIDDPEFSNGNLKKNEVILPHNSKNSRFIVDADYLIDWVTADPELASGYLNFLNEVTVDLINKTFK